MSPDRSLGLKSNLSGATAFCPTGSGKMYSEPLFNFLHSVHDLQYAGCLLLGSHRYLRQLKDCFLLYRS